MQFRSWIVGCTIPEMQLNQEALDKIRQRFNTLSDELTQHEGGDGIANLAKEYSKLKPIVDRIESYEQLVGEIEETESLLEDAELKLLAEQELLVLRQRLSEEETALNLELLPKDNEDRNSVIIEIRAGTGGEEAALFAGDLFGLYERYAALRGWKFEILNSSPTGLGGFREVTAAVKGKSAYSKLKFESGVHRVQRVPKTESSGRIHTSAATVAVLPEPDSVDIELSPNDLRIDTMRASGAGGQHVNKTDSAVRITHLPTGIVATSSQKSQHANRTIAMQVLRARLYDLERSRTDSERAANRRSQVGTGDRSERIRTYNYPQGRVTDHRIGLTLYKLDFVFEGHLDELVNALTTHERTEKLANISE